MTFTFKHPKYYTELRKRNKSDQAISLSPHDGVVERAPDPGLSPASSGKHKPQAPSFKRQAQIKNYNRRQAPSSKRQASSHKRQAP
jgi:hypothetical protein